MPEVVRQLRQAGYGFSESIGALVREGGMHPSDARAVVSESPVWADVRELPRETTEGRRLRVEPIAVADPPDAELVGRMLELFQEMPQILEAYLVGEHLIPEDGSEPFDTSSVVLVLDPPPTGEADTRLNDVAALTSALSSLGWDRPPARTWAFAPVPRNPTRRRIQRSHLRRKGELIYSRA